MIADGFAMSIVSSICLNILVKLVLSRGNNYVASNDINFMRYLVGMTFFSKLVILK